MVANPYSYVFRALPLVLLALALAVLPRIVREPRLADDFGNLHKRSLRVLILQRRGSRHETRKAREVELHTAEGLHISEEQPAEITDIRAEAGARQKNGVLAVNTILLVAIRDANVVVLAANGDRIIIMGGKSVIRRLLADEVDTDGGHFGYTGF